MTVDVSKKSEVETMVRDVIEKFGQIDIFFNNANNSSSCSSRRPVTATLIPARPSASAMPQPIPLEAPVTNAASFSHLDIPGSRSALY